MFQILANPRKLLLFLHVASVYSSHFGADASLLDPGRRQSCRCRRGWLGHLGPLHQSRNQMAARYDCLSLAPVTYRELSVLLQVMSPHDQKLVDYESTFHLVGRVVLQHDRRHLASSLIVLGRTPLDISFWVT